MKIELKERLNYVKNTYALFATDKDVNILFVNKEKFNNNPRLYVFIKNLEYDYKVYLTKKNEILFATDSTGKTVVGIDQETFVNFDDIIGEIFM